MCRHTILRVFSSLFISVACFLVLLSISTAGVQSSGLSSPAPESGSWSATSLSGAPSARWGQSAVSTGDYMLVWGGCGFYQCYNGEHAVNTGARYYPLANVWTPLSVTEAPTARYLQTAIWTGTQMIVWGGRNEIGAMYRSGGRYTLATGEWTETNEVNAPVARFGHTAVWTGSRMIVWGGVSDVYYTPLNSGGVYFPSTNIWGSTSMTGAPEARYGHTAVWTGSKMIIWGGYTAQGATNTGYAYDASMNTWSPISTMNAPSARAYHTAVVIGTKMIVWGGGAGGLNTGGIYDLTTDIWSPLPLTGAPSARSGHSAVVYGSTMTVWGGYAGGESINTGAEYNIVTNTWSPIETTGTTPSSRFDFSMVQCGPKTVVWGGVHISSPYQWDVQNTGAVYSRVYVRELPVVSRLGL